MFNIYLWTNARKELVTSLASETEALDYVKRMGAIDITADPDYDGCYDVTDKFYRYLCIEPEGFKVNA